jgi:thiosulfate dehydrogenase
MENYMKEPAFFKIFMLFMLFTFLLVFSVFCEDAPLPRGKLGEMIALGREISLNTAKHELSKKYVGNALNCSSCHLKNGTDLQNLSFIGVARGQRR